MMMNNTVSFDEGLSSSSSILSSMANHDIHVLLVEHDSNDHDNAKQMLEYFSYKVTAVKLASTALTILSKGKAQLDVVIANSNSPDSCSFKLVQEASKMGILVILMSEEDNIATTMKALEEGAFLCIKKPIQVQTAMYLWQHMVREKMRSLYREIERIVEDPLKDCSDSEEVHRPTKRNANGIHIAAEEDASRNGNPNNNDVTYQKKVWIEWTQELHDKFVAAIRILGQGRCYPKDILELMNVPGLTRMQVASHLQKCRGGKWQPPNERKSKTSNSNNNQETARPSKNVKPRRAQPMRFGSMPFPHEDPSMQLGTRDPNGYRHQDFATIQKTGHQICALETGVYNSSANTDRHQVYRHPHFAADLSHQDHYSQFTANNGSKETFNLGQQAGSNNVSKEVPFFEHHQVFDFQSGVGRSVNCSNQRNNVDNGEGAFGYAGLTTAQNLSSLQQEFGVMNNNGSGISMQPFVFDRGYYDQNQLIPDVATDGSTDEDFDSLLREED